MNKCPFCKLPGVRADTLRQEAKGVFIYEYCTRCLSTWSVMPRYGFSLEAKEYCRKAGVK